MVNGKMRYYSASLGKWMSRDLYGEKGGLDLYCYASNNPISVIDPFGMWTFHAHCGCLTASLGPGLDHSDVPSSSYLELLFKADKKQCKCVCCEEVKFIQIYYAVITGGWNSIGTIIFGNVTFGSWTLDADKGKEPWYPHSYSFSDWSAFMTDEPFLTPSAFSGIYESDFEVCAVCSRGDSKGTVFGCLKWGHSFEFDSNFRPQIVDWHRYINNKYWGRHTPTENDSVRHGNVHRDPQDDPPVSVTVCDQEPSNTMKSYLDKWLP